LIVMNPTTIEWLRAMSRLDTRDQWQREMQQWVKTRIVGIPPGSLGGGVGLPSKYKGVTQHYLCRSADLPLPPDPLDPEGPRAARRNWGRDWSRMLANSVTKGRAVGSCPTTCRAATASDARCGNGAEKKGIAWGFWIGRGIGAVAYLRQTFSARKPTRLTTQAD